jgi:chemotaxis protein histidine kinase CheA
VTVPPEAEYQDRNDERNAELRQLFFESAQELLQTLNEQAMLLEKTPGLEEPLRSVRRTVHTLKGDAAACGYRELSELAHELEDVLALDATEAAAVPDSGSIGLGKRFCTTIHGKLLALHIVASE